MARQSSASPGSPAPVRRTRNDPRRQATPKRLLAAARTVFERDGYYNARLSDITAEANLAAGTLYTYYSSKQAIFRDIVQVVVGELTAPAPDHVSSQHDPVRRLEEVNRVYVRAVRRNARVLALLQQTAETDDELRSLSQEITRHFQDRAVAAVTRWQRDGLAHDDLDPVLTAHALTYMVERVAMAWAGDRSDYDEATLIRTINQIWLRSLGLDPTD